ncbi:MAG: tRNA (N6-isopentenyl adenosine(37)-C2)-methylthiotransferase MiaB [Caldisericia bacterium]|nr:tRNA (N6-isopentenyl adenosine(37)-C2)-methylthiotransferase MiaB [Caldisericia bacterium]MDD4614796.1 tRNA (N6-isopentenyl adenosine(37)-C2)-methylthiotransferase MiaB [Caldisericia bacterium]
MPFTKTKYFIQTIGCQMNSYDSSLYEDILQQHGMIPASTSQEADFIIINTCAVRDKSVQKAASAIGRIHHRKVKKPSILLCVVGCASDLLAKLSHHNAIDYLHGALNSTQVDSDFLLFLKEQGFSSDSTPSFTPTQTHPKELSKYIPIIFGCDSFCTYCIVPYVRGREKSRPVNAILRDVEQSLQEGVKEIILLGQNVNCYGKDLHPSILFSELLDQVSSNPDIQRLDFLTSHPREFNKDLLEIVRRHNTIVKRFHFPVQHGDNEILKKMKRGYTAEEYLEKISWIRSYFPHASITTDVIVGFPGETTLAFDNTLALMEQVRFDSVFGAVYSPRPGTKAATFDNHVSPMISKDRLNILLTTQKRIAKTNLQRFLHQTCKVFVLHTSGQKGIGKTWEDRLIQFPLPSTSIPQPGDIVHVSVDCVQNFTLQGQLVHF